MSGTRDGMFVWYELMTTDPAAARAFYADLIGWETRETPMPGGGAQTYTILSDGETMVAGLMELPEPSRAMGTPPTWLGYVWAEVDATADRVKALGGRIYVEPCDIPGVGRFAVAADPQAAVFALLSMPEPPPAASPAMYTPRRIGWHELYAADWQAVFPFYAELFGWQKAESFDMGEMGTYQLFAKDGVTLGGMMTRPPNMPASFWQYYLTVPDIDAAAARVTAGGGRILHGPSEVPGGGWIVQALDPQGAAFALLGQRS